MNRIFLDFSLYGARMRERRGYVMLYVLGLLLLLGFYATISLANVARDVRSIRNHVRETQALYHAEAGARLVKAAVEDRLESGMDMRAALSGLTVTAPTGFEFDSITQFDEIVPGKLFRFTSVGRSGDAEAVLEVQYRRGDPLLKAGIFGVIDLSSQPNVSVYGYDGLSVENPTPGDSNGLATIGSNIMVSLQNGFTLDGKIILGADEDGTPASTSRADGFTQEQIGHLEPDPLGANDGGLADTFARVSVSNDNNRVTEISGNALDLRPGSTVVFPSGDYYFTDLYTPPRTTVVIDDTDGPVRFYVDGEVVFQPNSMTQDADAYNFQIYSISSESLTIKPNGDFSGFIYAPNAQVGLWPNGDFRGAVWSDTVQLQPGGDLFVDTSLLDRFLSTDLSVHAWIERREN